MWNKFSGALNQMKESTMKNAEWAGNIGTKIAKDFVFENPEMSEEQDQNQIDNNINNWDLDDLDKDLEAQQCEDDNDFDSDLTKPTKPITTESQKQFQEDDKIKPQKLKKKPKVDIALIKESPEKIPQIADKPQQDLNIKKLSPENLEQDNSVDQPGDLNDDLENFLMENEADDYNCDNDAIEDETNIGFQNDIRNDLQEKSLQAIEDEIEQVEQIRKLTDFTISNEDLVTNEQDIPQQEVENQQVESLEAPLDLEKDHQVQQSEPLVNIEANSVQINSIDSLQKPTQYQPDLVQKYKEKLESVIDQNQTIESKLTKEITCLQSQLSTLKNSSTLSQDEMIHDISELSKNLNETKMEKEQLFEDNSKLREYSLDLSKKLNEIKSTKDKLFDENDSMKDYIKKVTNTIKKKEEELNKLIRDKDNLSADLHKHKDFLNKERDEKKILNNTVKAQVKTIKDLEDKCGNYKALIQDKNEQVLLENEAKGRSEKEKISLKRQHDALKAEFDKIQNDMKKMNVENEALKSKVSNFESDFKQNIDLEKRLISHEDEMNNRELVIDSLRETNNNFKEIIENNQENYDLVVNEYENKIKQLETEKQDYLTETRQSKTKLAELKNLEESQEKSNQKNKDHENQLLTVEKEKQKIQQETSALIAKVKNENSYKDNLIDKRLVGNFQVNYFDLGETSEHRFQLLETLSSMLSFTDEEKIKIGQQKEVLKKQLLSEAANPIDNNSVPTKTKDPKGMGDRFMNFQLGDDNDDE